MNPEQNQQAPAPHKNTLMAILAYLGILIVIPYFSAKNDPFVKFHIRQGLVLFVVEIVIWLLSHFFWGLWWSLGPVINIINLAIFVLAVLGIINAFQGKEKELPLVGHLGSKFKV